MKWSVGPQQRAPAGRGWPWEPRRRSSLSGAQRRENLMRAAEKRPPVRMQDNRRHRSQCPVWSGNSFASPQSFEKDARPSLSARTLLKDLLRDRHRREHVRPADVEGEMGDGFGDLRLRQPIVHPNGDMTGELRDLTGGDERADGDEAAVAG